VGTQSHEAPSKRDGAENRPRTNTEGDTLMRVVRPPWACHARVLSVALAGALLLAGCGSSSPFTPGTPVVTMGNPGTTSDFAAYIITIDGFSLNQSNGVVVTPLVTPETVDLSNLTTLSELVEAPAVAAGTYTSASITLDYTTASIWLNVDGQPVPVTANDTSGVAFSTSTVTVNFDPNNPLVITNQQSIRLQITIDPAASNTVTTTSPYTATVQPFVVISPAPVDSTVMRARGLFVVSQPAQSNFIMNVRPFYDLVSALGAVQVNTNAQTYFNISGAIYLGAAGLNAMTTQQEAFPLAAIGTLDNLSGITPTFNASQVYMGVSLESPVAEYVSGVVAGRVGDALTVKGATFFSPLGTVGYYDSFPVAVGSATQVTQDGVAAPNLSIGSISIGQQIFVAGQQTTDSSGVITGLDASPGLLRLQQTPVWGTLNSATANSASLDVLTLGSYAPAGFNFTGTGSTPVDPATYQVNTGAIDEATVPAGTLLLANGVVAPFGTAPPAFNASSVTPGTATEQQLLVEWVNGGPYNPFSSVSSAGLVVDLANADLGPIHYIKTGPATLDLKSLPASPLITTTGANQSNLQLAIGNASLGIFLFNSYAGFETKLTSMINDTNRYYRLVAYGQYNSTTNTFVASRIDVAVYL
jgi:hypothetical protein